MLDDFKKQIMDYTRKLKDAKKEVEEPWETITLYHGTTSRYLNSILKNGLQPRHVSNVNNFKEVPSNEELIYFSTKWHYWYAYNANQESLIEQVGEERFETTPIIDLWNETSDFPMYISCEVPLESLTLDEDVVYQRDIRKKIREKIITKPEDISVEECLQQGTIASIHSIPLVSINEIGILGSEKLREELIDGAYGTEISGWFNGFGVGELTEWDITLKILTTYQSETTIFTVYPNPEENKLVKRIQNLNGTLMIEFED